MSKKPHYAWFVLLGCCLLQGGTLGVIYNCQGVFYTPVSEAFGFSVGDVAMCRTLLGVGSCVMLPFAGKLLEKYDVRITLTAATVIFAFCTFFMSTFDTLFEWYAASVLQGLAGAFLLFVPTPIILNRWFHKGTGTAMGVSSAFSGIAGVVMNPICGHIIETGGYPAGYRLLAVVCLAMSLPATLLLLRSRPSELGLRPYGAAQSENEDAAALSGPPMGEIARSPWFCISVVSIALLGFGGGSAQSFTGFGVSLGMSVTAGSALVSAAMAGNLVGKVGLGLFNDKAGIRATLYLNAAAVLCGYAIMATCGMPLLLGGAFFCGTSMSMSAVLIPALTKKMFGARAFASAYSWVTAAYTLVNSFAPTLNGYIFDATGNYIPAWIVVICVVFTGGVLTTVCMRAVEKKYAL